MRSLLILICCALNAKAALWYVDNAAVGTGAGTSWANAWTGLTAVVWGSIAAGDTIYMSGGTSAKVYTNASLDLAAYGTSANWITLASGVDANHTGKVIFDGWNVRIYAFKLYPYWILDGRSGLGLTNMVFTNYVSSTTVRDDGGGVAFWTYDNALIKNIEIVDAMNGIYMATYTNQTVQNCWIHSIQGDHAIRSFVTGSTNSTSVLIQSNTIVCNADWVNSGTNNQGGPDGLQLGYAFTVRGNIIKCVNGRTIGNGFGASLPGGYQHPDGIQTSGGDSGSVCEGNYLENWSNYPVFYDNFLGASTNGIVRNNKAFNNRTNAGDQAFAIAASSTNPRYDFKLINNTSDGFTTTYAFWTGSAYPSASTFFNCLVANNVAFNSSSTNKIDSNVADFNNVRRSAIQASNDCVVYVTGLSNNNYRLTSSATTLIGQGTNLTGFAVVDYDGTAWSVPYDVGAFKFSSGVASGGSQLNASGTARVGTMTVP